MHGFQERIWIICIVNNSSCISSVGFKIHKSTKTLYICLQPDGVTDQRKRLLGSIELNQLALFN